MAAEAPQAPGHGRADARFRHRAETQQPALLPDQGDARPGRPDRPNAEEPALARLNRCPPPALRATSPARGGGKEKRDSGFSSPVYGGGARAASGGGRIPQTRSNRDFALLAIEPLAL